MKRALIVIIASLAGLLPASAQDYEKHGEIISVNLANKEITVSMDAAYSVVVGTSGNVIETENIFGRDEKSAIAVIEVSKVDGRNVTCSILNSNTNPSGEMYVSFESVQAVSEAGRLVIKAIPAGAVINLDGTDRGPAPQTFDLASGTHTVKVSAPGYESETYSYTIVASESIQRTYKLSRVARFGSIYIESEPSSAAVYLDSGSESLGRTNLTVPGISAGPHSLKLSLAGYELLDTTITVRASERSVGIFQMKPMAKDSTFLEVSTNAEGKLIIVANYKPRRSSRPGVLSESGQTVSNEMILIIKTTLDDGTVVEEAVSLFSGVSRTLASDLMAPVKYGLLDIHLDPPDLHFAVTGPGGYSFEDSTDVQLEVQPGRYLVRFFQEGYVSTEIEYDVLSGYTTPGNVSLAMSEFTATAGIEFLRVWAGDFDMGSVTGDADERPQFGVTLTTDFYMSRYEITQGEYEKIMGVNPSKNQSGEGLPVESVTWIEAAYFANVLSELEGLEKCYSESSQPVGSPYRCMGYRLPTEAEWEYAAKITVGSAEPPISRDKDLLRIGWFLSNSEDKIHGVGLQRTETEGFVNLLGNVWEWTNDWYAEDYSGAIPENPVGPVAGTMRVARGGSFKSAASLAYLTDREKYNPDGSPLDNFGIRLVRSAR